MSTPGRILIVEDEAITAMALAVELERAGFTICGQVAVGEDVKALVESESPDLILFDIRLAGPMDGIEAARSVREGSEVPIIFVSGYDDEALRERALEVGPLGYYLKPVRLEDILPAIRFAIESRGS